MCRIVVTLLILTVYFLPAVAQNFVLSGHVSNLTTGESLTGAAVVLENDPSQGAVTNSYGFYSLSLPPGSYRIVIRFIGYEPVTIPVTLNKHLTLNAELKSASYNLGDIRVTARQSGRNVTSTDMGTVRMVPDEIESIPVIFGEKDILKTIQLSPGIKPAGEGSSGFHVRGGDAGQNLILLDEAPVYNPSHLLGFFSVFNSDALKEATMMKGSVPAEYGGRASSVLDIRMKEGNLKKFAGKGNLGLISSSFTVEGPFAKDKSSFLLSGRRTYADLFLHLSDNPDIRNSHLYFYDLNMKTNFRINDNNRIYLTGYMGRDDFDYKNNFRLDWGSLTGTFRWNCIISEKLFSNTSFIYSNYSSNVTLVREYDIRFSSVIRDLHLKHDLTWYLNNRNTIRFGFNVIDHALLPGRIKLTEAYDIEQPDDITERNALEWAVYLSNDQHLSKRWRIYYGLRLAVFSNTGPGDFYEFSKSGELKNTVTLSTPEIFNTYRGIEPRLSANYRLSSNASLKASFSRMHQFLHLLGNATASVPTDIWLPSSNNVKPQIADQVSLGYFSNFFGNEIESSFEVYYKDLKNQIEYRNAAELVYDSTIETELAFGRGWAYGAEFLLRRNIGRVNGWLSYTWSKTMRLFDEVNNGKPFPAHHDRRHDFSAAGTVDVLKRLKFSAVWVYYTGNAVTVPSGKYLVEQKVVSYYTERNSYRMPDYHRLDLSLILHGKKQQGFESSWHLSVYNAYGRENAWVIKFRPKDDRPGEMEAVKVSLFKAIPSLSYRFRF